MRFRWLFLGYLLMFSIPIGEVRILPVLGYALMLFAMLRLSNYESAFAKAKYILFAAVPLGAILFGFELYLTFAAKSAFGGASAVHTVLQWADELIEMAVMFFVYIGVRIMGDRTEIKALTKHSSRNMAVMFVYLLTETVLSLLHTFAPHLFVNFGMIMLYPFVLGFIWRVLNLWMIFTCFLGIADSAEERK